MLKFKRPKAANYRPKPANWDGTAIYLCVDFFDSNQRVVHHAVVTAEELQHFPANGCSTAITGFMSEDEAAKLTLEQRGMLPAPLERPEQCPEHIWDKANNELRAFIVEHQRLHELAFAEYKQRVAAALDLEEYRWGV